MFRGQDDCPRCTPGPAERRPPPAATAASVNDEWTIVARFANAAEAGYFANELDYALGLEPRLDCCDDFDAIRHHWRSGFVLSVPEPLADRARATLKDLLESDPEADVSRDTGVPASATMLRIQRGEWTANSPKPVAAHIIWGPLLLTLAAGSLVAWHGKKPVPQVQPAPRDALRIPLREAPGLSDSAWIQAPGGGTRRELVFPAAGGTARFREDRDGDGVFEHEYSLSIGE